MTYRPGRHLLSLSGLLLIICVTHALGQATWVDPSPHRQRFVSVGSNTNVEVLDWGGSGQTVVLLAQLGQTAHIYDAWAPTLTEGLHVVGVTRRGYGQSSMAAPYSAETLATDVLEVLDAEKISSPVLVGNGFAGEEMLWIASHIPNRLHGLIFLNAAYDRSNVAEETVITRRIPTRGPGPDDLASPSAMARWSATVNGLPIPEAEIRQVAQLGSNGRITGQRTPPSVQQQILAGMEKYDWSAIRVPTLAIYTPPTSSRSFPGCRDATDATVLQACDELFAWSQQQLANSQKLLRRIPARTRIEELPGADAFTFLSNPADMTRAVEQFVDALAR